MNHGHPEHKKKWTRAKTQLLLYPSIASYFVVAPLVGFYDWRYGIGLLLAAVVALCTDVVLYLWARRRRKG